VPNAISSNFAKLLQMLSVLLCSKMRRYISNKELVLDVFRRYAPKRPSLQQLSQETGLSLKLVDDVGRYSSPVIAAKAYNQARAKLHGRKEIQ
jgi:hypothetical protein